MGNRRCTVAEGTESACSQGRCRAERSAWRRDLALDLESMWVMWVSGLDGIAGGVRSGHIRIYQDIDRGLRLEDGAQEVAASTIRYQPACQPSAKSAHQQGSPSSPTRERSVELRLGAAVEQGIERRVS
jgi:hypothetical protein